MEQLISYIAPAAPATRRPAPTEPLPFIRLECGFTPQWFRQHLDIDFGEKYHLDVLYRKQAYEKMRSELKNRFPSYPVGILEGGKNDLLTGLYGGCFIAAVYGIKINYYADNWPACGHNYLSSDQIDTLFSPDLSRNPSFLSLIRQIEEIHESEGEVTGFINWQGVVNNALKIRGNDLFFDFFEHPKRCHKLFGCITTTMIEGIKILREHQQLTGIKYDFFTVSNCSVNMLSPDLYEEFLLPYDRQIASEFSSLGIHNCAWNATPYMEAYATIRNLGYIDMGIDSDLVKAKKLFPACRRAIMYTPMDAVNKSLSMIEKDIDKIAGEYAPCDLIIADIEAGTDDKRITDILEICNCINETNK